MDHANVTATSPQSEPDLDNSSLQNPSTNPAEAGTTDETRDEDHETSSIEALNWSEVEEEELAAAQQAEALAAAAAASGQENTKSSSEVKVKANDESDNTEQNGSSTNGSSAVLVNDEGNVLSTSLLQSINSTISDEDPEARKLSVIETWASEVTNAVERGEMEMGEDFPDEDGNKGDDENEIDDDADSSSTGVRKRRGKKLSPGMVTSVMSSASNGGESSLDPLSNAPVLDDGPIWDKGPRSYTFQENRRMNQKLTFCVLIAVVLAIGLGLGNLVAHQECEAEFKASQKASSVNTINTKPVERSPVPQTIPTTTTPSPIIPDRSTDSSMMSSKLPPKQTLPSLNSGEMDNDEEEHFKNYEGESLLRDPKEEAPERKNIKRDEPIIDPKYKIHAETVSSVVHTLDQLSRKIDQFENTTRKLQGVLMIPDEEKKQEETTEDTLSSLYDEVVHRDDGQPEDFNKKDDDEPPLETDVDDLIDAIEQTPDYLEMKKEEERLKELNKDRPRSKLFDLDKILPVEINREWKKMMKSFEKYQEFERRFIKNERKRLVEEGKYDRFKWRVPDQYTDEEKKQLNEKFKNAWIKYIKLTNNDEPEPLNAIFGEDEEVVERKYGDVFHYPWPDPDIELTDEEYAEEFSRNLEDWKERLKTEEGQQPDIPDLSIEDVFPADSYEEAVDNKKDDIVVFEEIKESGQSYIPPNDDKKLPPVPAEEEEKATVVEPQLSEVRNGGGGEQGKNVRNAKGDSENIPVNLRSASQSENIAKSNNDNRSNESNQKSFKNNKRNFNAKKQKDSNFHKTKSSQTPSSPNEGNNQKIQNAYMSTNFKKGKYSEQSWKEGKAKQGKHKGNSLGNGSGTNNVYENTKGANGKIKLSKHKKFKNLESNKVFENVKGKNSEKRRASTPTVSSSSSEEKYSDRQREQNLGNHTKKPNNGASNDSKSKDKQNERDGKFHHEQQNKYKSKKEQKDSKEYRKQQRQPPKDNPERENSASDEKKSDKMKHDSQKVSSKETQYRQQKQEFNANRYNGGKTYDRDGKKSKDRHTKEKVEKSRDRDRVTSRGN